MRHAHQRRPQQPFAQLVAAADLLGHMLVGHIVALHRSQRLMHARIERLAHRRQSRVTCIFSRTSSICFTISSTPERNCSADPVDFQRQLKVVQHRQKLLHHAARRIVAKLRLLALGALARILKLRLQPRQPIQQLIALRLQLLDLRLAASSVSPCRLSLGQLLIAAAAAPSRGSIFAPVRALRPMRRLSRPSTRSVSCFGILPYVLQEYRSSLFIR